VNSTVDTTRGVVTLTSVAPGGGLQTANFAGGVFRVSKTTAAATQLTLAGGNFGVCNARRTAAKPRPKRRTTVVRRLWGNGKGRFATAGRYAAATVRGTVWRTDDRCDGTLVFVKRGRVAVFDRRRHRTVIVTAGHSYLARR
jgi:hypothetical protein